MMNQQTTAPPTYPKMTRLCRTLHLSCQSGRRVSRLTTTLLDRGRRGPDEHERHRSGNAEGERVCGSWALVALFFARRSCRISFQCFLASHTTPKCGFEACHVILGSVSISIVNIISFLTIFDFEPRGYWRGILSPNRVYVSRMETLHTQMKAEIVQGKLQGLPTKIPWLM